MSAAHARPRRHARARLALALGLGLAVLTPVLAPLQAAEPASPRTAQAAAAPGTGTGEPGATGSAAPASPALTLPAPAGPAPAGPSAAAQAETTRNGRQIYQRFREGLADPSCEPGVSARWRQHFATAPRRLAAREDDLLPLFGYVVDALREAHLPTEYALIPFVESGYRPGARSAAGPAGLWQMIALTARNHRVPIREGYDGRLSPVDSTQAAVRYLKTLHGMFGGDWRLTVMAYNAGEYRVLNAIRRSGRSIAEVGHDELTGLSDITTAYVRKLHALSCLMEQAEDREEWLAALDRPVPRLEAVSVPEGVDSIGEWAARTGQDAKQLMRLNPVFAEGRIARAGGKRAPLLAVAQTAVGAPGPVAADRVLAGGALPAADSPAPAAGTAAARATPVALASSEPAPPPVGRSEAAPRRHTVGRGDTAWTIARRYGIKVADLLGRNGLSAKAVLKPGQALLIDPPARKRAR